MISEITPEGTVEFVSKYQFSDGLIRTVVINLSGESTERQARVTCSVRRRDDYEWCNLILHMRGLSAFRAVHGTTSYIVLSDEVQVAWFDGRIYLDLAPYTSEPESEEDYLRSEFFFCGSALAFEEAAYDERPTL